MAKNVLVPKIPNGEITSAAKAALKGHFALCALIAFAIFLTSFVGELASGVFPVPFNYIFSGFLSAIFNYLCGIAYLKYCGTIANGNENPSFFQCIPFAFKRFARITISGWYITLIVILKLFLLIIPGILAMLDYSVATFILLEDEDISIGNALKRSRRLMYGHRWQFFCLGWRFFGWALLCFLTFGIGFCWLIPYAAASYWKFYRSIIPEPDVPENEELPPLASCSQTSVAVNAAIFVLYALLAAFSSYAESQEQISDRISDKITATEKTETLSGTADVKTIKK